MAVGGRRRALPPRRLCQRGQRVDDFRSGHVVIMLAIARRLEAYSFDTASACSASLSIGFSFGMRALIVFTIPDTERRDLHHKIKRIRPPTSPKIVTMTKTQKVLMDFISVVSNATRNEMAVDSRKIAKFSRMLSEPPFASSV